MGLIDICVLFFMLLKRGEINGLLQLIVLHNQLFALIAMFVLFLILVAIRVYDKGLKYPIDGSVGYRIIRSIMATTAFAVGWLGVIFIPVSILHYGFVPFPMLDKFFNIVYSSFISFLG